MEDLKCPDFFPKTELIIISNNSDSHMVYVLLDGVGDLPHPDLEGKTPLQVAKTPNMDKLAMNGVMGEVISVGKGMPQSQILQFSICWDTNFVMQTMRGRGVIEAIGVGIDFKDGDLAFYEEILPH